MFHFVISLPLCLSVVPPSHHKCPHGCFIYYNVFFVIWGGQSFHWDGKIVGFYFEILILQYHKQSFHVRKYCIDGRGGGVL